MEFNNSGSISFLSMTANNDQYYVVYNPTSSSTSTIYQCKLPNNYTDKNECSTLESYIKNFYIFRNDGTNFTVTGSFSNGSLSASVSSNLSIVCTNSYTDCSCTVPTNATIMCLSSDSSNSCLIYNSTATTNQNIYLGSSASAAKINLRSNKIILAADENIGLSVDCVNNEAPCFYTNIGTFSIMDGQIISLNSKFNDQNVVGQTNSTRIFMNTNQPSKWSFILSTEVSPE